MKQEDDWRFSLAVGLVLLSLVPAAIIAFDLPGWFETTSIVQKVAAIYLVSFVLVVPAVIYFLIALMVIEIGEAFCRLFRFLIGKPLPPKPPLVTRPYRPRPPGCRFPGDYYSGE